MTEFQCDCGNRKVILEKHVKAGLILSCRCLQAENTGNRFRKHGAAETDEYRIFRAAKSRCTNPNVKRYKDYGGRGIEFRFASFEEFYEALGPRPSPKHSIDRIDNNGHYEKGNVRWATQVIQNNNQRPKKLKI